MLRGVGFIRRLSNLRRVNATREPLVRLPFRPPAAHVVQLEPLPWNVAFWQCAPKARITCGGRIHPENCRLIW
jgi:hypothetical protein